jgi:hypothetical protein
MIGNEVSTFDILEVSTEKKPDGFTTIKAKCVEYKVNVMIDIPNRNSGNRELIKKELIKKYYKNIENIDNMVRVGEVI